MSFAEFWDFNIQSIDARRAGSDGSMSASGSAGAGFDPRRGIGIGIDFDICPWSYGPVSEPLFWLLIHNPHWPCWSKKRKHSYQKKANSRNAICRITFMNYVMKEYTNLNYMSRWAGLFFHRLNEIYIDNTPGTHSDTCNIKTVPVILNGLGVQQVHFPLLPSFRISLVQSDTKWWLISATCHMGKKLALNLSFTNVTCLNRCPYLYHPILDILWSWFWL